MPSLLNPDVAALLREEEQASIFDLDTSDHSVTSDYHSVVAAARTKFGPAIDRMRGPFDLASWEVDVRDDALELPHSIPIRIYEPVALYRAATTMVYFHGGGWVLGTLDTLDPELRWFSHRLGCKIVAVDYRLAPEHPYPAAFLDCLGVVQKLHELWPNERLCVAGDSAGGNLAAAVGIACRDLGIPLVGQLLIYPAVDPTQEHPSHEQYAQGYLLTRADMAMYWACYLPDRRTWATPTAVPLVEADLSRVAPAVVVTAGFDPLSDEGHEYAARLRLSGVRAEHLRSPGLPHGFITMTGRIPAAAEAVEQFLFHFADVIDSGPQG
ncbi:alpha/beta hydrolase [Micromonospora sp. B11E3]|uniref:alpha/beta hydrolase n=1 Tax=Micromonospora sp. B11E3 TaxID=3153562 RepID=UPI00325F8185